MKQVNNYDLIDLVATIPLQFVFLAQLLPLQYSLWVSPGCQLAAQSLPASLALQQSHSGLKNSRILLFFIFIFFKYIYIYIIDEYLFVST